VRPFPFASLALLVTVFAAPHRAQGRAAVPLAPQQDSNWLAAASAEVERAEYHFNPVRDEPEVWSAPNRAHEFRSRVSPRGLEVFPRTTSADGVGAPWTLRLRTTSFGRTDGTFELPPATLTPSGARVELDHGHAVEWLENTSQGLEQGWTIPARPPGAGELWLGLELTGDLSLRIEDGARSAVLVDPCGEVVLRYRDLHVYDATGRELSAQLRPSQHGLGITVDDERAYYPLTLDPVLTGPAWTAESDQADAFFGWTVASAGDVNGDRYGDVIVGAPRFDNGQTDEGRAFVYFGSPFGLATSHAWMAEPSQQLAHFGHSVACAGDVNGDGYGDVIVGARLFDSGQWNEQDHGGTFLYFGSPTGPATSPDWWAVSNQSGAYFGYSVASAGDVNADGFSDVIVGSPRHSNGEYDEGRAYVYLGSPSGLALTPDWTAESDQAGAWFGHSVASAGDVNADGYGDVIVGSFQFDWDVLDEGRAFVFLGSASGLATSPAWTAEGDQSLAEFGVSVACAGDVNGDGYGDVIVGAHQSSLDQLLEGCAFVYLGSASGLATSPAWTAEGDQTGSFFGSSVANAGDVNGDGYSDVIVGAYGVNDPQTDVGGAFVYFGSTSGLATRPSWIAKGSTGSLFGFSVGSAGDVNADGYSDVIVGSPRLSNVELDEGRACVYLGSPSGLATIPEWAALGARSASAAGDVNGDGYGDVVLGKSDFDNGQFREGGAFVYLGSPSGPAVSPAWAAEGDQEDSHFGHLVASAGDVNGDGFGDLIVGAPYFDNDQINEGRVFAYMGSTLGLATSPAWTTESDQNGAALGQSAASAGDVNGDGYGDVIIGSMLLSTIYFNAGGAYVYHGSSVGLTRHPAWFTTGDRNNATFATSVASAGDTNGDGYGDVIIGAINFSNGETEEGCAYAYMGSPSGLALSPDWTAEGNSIDALFGCSVSSAGDVNGDGFSDVLVGAKGYSNFETTEGHAYLFFGSPLGLSSSAAWTVESNQAYAYFASSVAGAGDVNGDGFSDVIVGAPHYNSDPHPFNQSDEGRVYVYMGSSSGLSASASWMLEGGQDYAYLGSSVACTGDVNGDGFSDVVVVASGEDRAFVYFGNSGYGSRVRGLQQRRKNNSSPLAVMGAVGRDGLFRIRCEFPRNAAGFAWASPAAPEAWLEWEVKPLGVAFDGSEVQAGTPQALGAGGDLLTFDELAAVPDTVRGHARTAPQSFHWRARVATNSPLFPNTAWFSVQGSNVTEAKLRKPWR